MSYAGRMLETYRRVTEVDAAILAGAIEALYDCAQACIADVDADLSEPSEAEMVRCIRLCLHCADVCLATGGVSSRPAELPTEVITPLLEACVAVCRACGDECERHSQEHEHCRICAETCRRCEQACRQLLAALK